MSLSRTELSGIAEELDAGLRRAIVQRVFLPSEGRAYLELRRPGSSTLLCVCVEPQVARLSVAGSRPPSPPSPPALQHVLRARLTGARLVRVFVSGDRAATLEFERQGERWELSADLGAHTLTLLDPQGHRLGGRPVSTAPERVMEQPGRLQPVAGAAFPLAEAAEALLEAEGRTRAVEAHRKRALDRLKTKLSRLERTLVKVEEERARGPLAAEHQELGTLLGQNLQRIPRGAREVQVTAYTEQGPQERTLSIDPSRSAREQMDWHFHQYRRLTRGVEFATRRRAELLEARDALLAEIERVRQTDFGAAADGGEARPPSPPPQKRLQHQPFKEYRGRNGERILVGRGGAENDRLTFGIARPHDLWLHARGVPGAHVVVPLDRGAELPQELLLDAAHLALHHSDARDEPRGEVSYTYAKFVRRRKGAGPGAVTYAQERTLVVRVEPQRLARLNASRPER